MKENYTDITFIVDRSGSMERIREDTIGGFNIFLKAQQNEEEGECTMSLVQFDDKYEVVYSGEKISDVPNLTKDTFVPRGWTALYDAIGKTIVSTGERYKAMAEDERPEKVLFVISTDGAENSSKEYNLTRISQMIKEQKEKYNWEFIFLGANLDAVKVGTDLGISMAKSMTYASNTAGTASAFRSLNKVVSGYRSGKTSSDFDQNDRDEQTKAGA